MNALGAKRSTFDSLHKKMEKIIPSLESGEDALVALKSNLTNKILLKLMGVLNGGKRPNLCLVVKEVFNICKKKWLLKTLTFICNICLISSKLI